MCNISTRLLPDAWRGGFQVDLGIAGNHAHQNPVAIAAQHQRLEHLADRLAELFGDVRGGQILFVHPVRDQLVGDLRPVEQAAALVLLIFTDTAYDSFARR